MSTLTTQLEAIHSMLAAGHRCVHMRRHSLVLWGVTGGVLCLATEYIITADRFPEHWMRATAVLVFLAAVLAAVAVVDFRYTRHRAQASDESIPFVEAQITKLWWLLIAMGVAFTFGTSFFGGGYMVFVAWLIVFGLGVYVHGLFSEQILEWAGVMMIVLGVAALAASVPYVVTQWLAASVFALGMPLLAAMLDRGRAKSAWIRGMQSALWLAVVLAPPFAAYEWLKTQDAPSAPALSLESFAREPEARGATVVTLPAGARIPVKVRIGGGVVQDHEEILPLTLARSIDVVLLDGKPDGRFRVEGGEWKRRIYGMWIRVLDMQGALTRDAGPAVSLKLDLTLDR